MADHDTRRTLGADDAAGGQEAYVEAVRRAEEAAAAAEAETTPPLPESDGAVLIQASDQPLPTDEPAEEADNSTEEAAEAEEQTPEQEAAEQLLLGKFKSVEDLQAAYLEVEAVLGRQGTEFGELRQAFDTLSAQIEANKPQLAPVQVTQELIDANPAQATLLAYDQKNEQALQIAFDAWKDEDPFSAGSWLAEKRLEQREAALNEKIASVESRFEELSKPQQEADERKQWSDAFAIVSKDHPDFAANAARILEEVAPNYPNILGTLASGDAKAKAEILTALYAIDRTGNPEQVAAQLKEAAAEATAEAEANRNSATVLTQATSGLGSEVELTANEQEQERYRQRREGKVSLERGWTGRAA